MTPHAYMLIDSLPTSAKHPRRTLTLIAKMLQNLANKPSYAKETYMMSLNPFVEAHKQKINLFLMGLCEVGDFYDTLEVSSGANCGGGHANTTTPDGSIYGLVQEGSSDQYYPE